jgi:hypothetical protein
VTPDDTLCSKTAALEAREIEKTFVFFFPSSFSFCVPRATDLAAGLPCYRGKTKKTTKFSVWWEVISTDIGVVAPVLRRLRPALHMPVPESLGARNNRRFCFLARNLVDASDLRRVKFCSRTCGKEEKKSAFCRKTCRTPAANVSFSLSSLSRVSGTMIALLALFVAAVSAETAFIRAFHAVPGGPVVDVLANGNYVWRNVPYTALSNYVGVPPGTYTIRVNVAGTDTPVLEGVNVSLGCAASVQQRARVQFCVVLG